MTALAPSSTASETAAGPSSSSSSTPLFTCLSCSIGFPHPEDQRAHYRTDLHRYNMKRRVASLPPVRADVFNAKVLESRKEAEQEQQLQHPSSKGFKGDKCEACNKSFSSLNASKDHMNSRKHKEMVKLVVASKRPEESQSTSATQDVKPDPLIVRMAPESKALEDMSEIREALVEAPTASKTAVVPPSKSRDRVDHLTVTEDATDEEVQAAIDAKLASTKRIDPSQACLFCTKAGFHSLDDSITHMSRWHGFWLPEQTYLVDKTGLMTYLSDKICVGNICLYCNGRGRGFTSAEATRKHMIDKSHCKVAYDFEEDKLELSDFYDFRSSYPDAAEWEDVSDEDEVVEGDEAVEMDEEDHSDGLTLPAEEGGIRFGDNELELILPSGARLGHRSLRRYYDQSLRPFGTVSDSTAPSGGTSGRQLAHRLNNMANRDDNALVQRGGNVVRVRNRGEAREAKRHVSEFRDMKRREQFKTRIGFRNNNQKHFRDPLLQ